MYDSVKENSSELDCQVDGAVKNFYLSCRSISLGRQTLASMSCLKVFPGGVSISHPSSISSFAVVTDKGASQDLSEQLRRRFLSQ